MIYLKNGTYIDPITLQFSKVNIAIEKGKEGKIIFTDEVPANAEVIDCTNKYITKSFVVGHHHAYSALATGMPSPAKSPKNFSEILEYVWWNLDKKLDSDSIKASAYITAMNSALCGSTFIIDHHASPFSIENSLDILAEAFEEVGVSHLLCYEISDRDGFDIAQKGLDETDKYLSKKQGLVGLHASFTVGNETLKKAAELVKKHDSGIHIHTAEDKVDETLCMERYNKTVIERLNDFDLLNSSKTIIAHAIHVNEKEREILKNSEAFVVQNPESNLNNQVGFFSAEGLKKENIILGTDGMHSDMIKSAQYAYFAGKAFDAPQIPDVYFQLRNNHNYLKKNNFKGDGENNLVVFDYNHYTDFNENNFLGHFFYAMNSGAVQHVISSGELIVKDRDLCKVNTKDLIKFAAEQAERLWKLL